MDDQVQYQKDGKEMFVPGDTVVVTMGSVPNTNMYSELINKVSKVEIIGDARDP